MNCLVCGHEFTNENARFCALCGADQHALKKAESASLCPSCGVELPNKDASFCPNCGNSLKASNTELVEPSPAPEPVKQFCSSCGYELANKNLPFCPKCGKQVNGAPKPEPKRFCPGCGKEAVDKTVDFCSYCGARLKPTTISINSSDLVERMKKLLNTNGASDVEKKSDLISAGSMVLFALMTFLPIYTISNIPFLSGSYSLFTLLNEFIQDWHVFSTDDATAGLIMTWSFFIVILWVAVLCRAGYSVYCVLKGKRVDIRFNALVSIFALVNLLSAMILESSLKSSAGSYSSLVSSINIISCTPYVWFLIVAPLAVYGLCYALTKK